MREIITIAMFVTIWACIYVAIVDFVAMDPVRHDCNLCAGDITLPQCRMAACENTI